MNHLTLRIEKVRQTPSLFRIIKVDYTASLGVIAPLVTWGLVLASGFFAFEAAALF